MSDQADKSGSEHFVTPPAAKPSFGARLKNHFKRFWWAHVIALIVVVLVVVLPVVYVGYPNIAQDDVNDSKLEVSSMEITDPAPDSFNLKLVQVISSSSSFHPRLDAFDATLTLAGAAAPFMTVRAPSIKAESHVESTIDQRVNLKDVGLFTDYSVAVMDNQEVNILVDGKTGLKQGSLPKTDVDYKKTVNMKGFNKLDGFNVTSIKLVTPPENGVNMKGNVFIPNPTVMTLTLGDVSLDLSVDNHPIGTAEIKDLVLSPGDNNVEMTAKVDQKYTIGLITNTDSPYKSGVVPIDIVGTSSVYNGQELPYFTKALADNKLTVDLNLLSAF